VAEKSKRRLMQAKREFRKSKRLNVSSIQPLISNLLSAGRKELNPMTYYNSFDSKIQCEEHNEVSPEEYDEVMLLMAQESEAQEGYGNWSDEDQRLWQAEQERLKCWTRNYSQNDDGDSYSGIAI
jgi:hypothetical protein